MAAAKAQLLCVFSTLSAPVEYIDWKGSPNGIPVAGDSVTIKGGAGVANANLLTPRGVATMVTDKQAELLKRNTVFQLHMANGFVAIDSVDRPPSADDVENAAASLEGRDVSAPLVPQDYAANGLNAPVVGDATK